MTGCKNRQLFEPALDGLLQEPFSQTVAHRVVKTLQPVAFLPRRI